MVNAFGPFFNVFGNGAVFTRGLQELYLGFPYLEKACFYAFSVHTFGFEGGFSQELLEEFVGFF
jgi:hypothetical protein